MGKKDSIKTQLLGELEKLKKIISEYKESDSRYKEMQAAIKAKKKEYTSLLDSLPMGIINLSKGGIITSSNKAIRKLLNCKKSDLQGKHFTEAGLTENIKIPYLKMFNFTLNGEHSIPFEINIDDGKGNEIYGEVFYNLVKNGNKITNIQIIVNDVTERKKAEKEIIFLRFHDQLTGLFNRAYIDEEIKRLDTERQIPISFIIGDINGLKLINEAFGIKEGDKLLNSISEIINQCCRSEDIIARWGEDEFAVLLPNTNEESANKIMSRIEEKCIALGKKGLDFTFALGAATKKAREQKFNYIIVEASDRMYRKKILSGKSTPADVVVSLIDSLIGDGFETREHAKRVEKMALEMGRILELPKSKLDELSLLSGMHDLGKIAIPEDILKKSERLTGRDWQIIKSYPEIGYNIAKASFKYSHIADYILSHHERWDGSGYPRGIKGEDIPMLSRIMAIVDAYDVMRSGRSYRNTRSRKEAIEELRRNSGKQFDPRLVEEFISLIEY